MLLDLYPSILAKRSVQARAAIVAAFTEYFACRGHEQGSPFVQAHYQHKIDQGLKGRDIASFEIGAIVALLSNTFAATFWVLYRVISDAAILQECRQEVLACCSIDERTCTLDITKVKSSSPVLSSVLKESLRFHGIGTSVRIVTEDHLLDGKYLLKKGGIVMIPGQVQHTSRAAYGEGVGEFQHKRFVRSKGRERPDPIAFRGFGGGTTLCPGRHFATTVVIAFVAEMILRFDFEPVAGFWRCPTTEKAGMHATVASPDEDVEVRVSPAVGEIAGKKLHVVLSGSDKSMELVAEDGA
jgi:cytochrome P450